MVKNIDRIEKNARAIKTVISLLVIIASMIYGFCIFIYQNQNHTKEINNMNKELLELKGKVINLEKSSSEKHQELNNKIALNEKDFQMTSAKLEVSLVKISADLQFIKEHLMERGMDGNERKK